LNGVKLSLLILIELYAFHMHLDALKALVSLTTIHTQNLMQVQLLLVKNITHSSCGKEDAAAQEEFRNKILLEIGLLTHVLLLPHLLIFLGLLVFSLVTLTNHAFYTEMDAIKMQGLHGVHGNITESMRW
jgi:hypothetical protein